MRRGLATYRGSGERGTPMFARDGDLPSLVFDTPVDEIELAGTVVHYLTPGLRFRSGLQIGGLHLLDGGQPVRRGHTRQVWNSAVIGPSFLLPSGVRTGDELVFAATGMFADGQPGRTGSDLDATGTAALSRDGEEIARTGLSSCDVLASSPCELRAALPAGSGAYTLTASLSRTSQTLSTGVTSAWTFRSTTGQGALPLMAVRYRPDGLDRSNRAA
ncbi:hypothetical protein [Nonomuraea sp. NPDC050310]|uniref:hypothetical protein n=1 Tax=Nonomuraea sp. NPDC050310 TaxID=3154935 RepID=UPI0033C9A383